MDLNIQTVLAIYKEELSEVKHENVILKAIQKQLEQEIMELRDQLKNKEGDGDNIHNS